MHDLLVLLLVAPIVATMIFCVCLSVYALGIGLDTLTP